MNNIHKLNGFIYVTSEEKPSIKDWSINLNCKYAHQELCSIDNEIELKSYVNSYENDCRKIILTNDPKLTTVQQLTHEEEAYCKTVDSVGVDSFKLNFGAILYRLQLPKQKEMKAEEIKAKDYDIICTKCKTDKFLKNKSYLMFHKLCTNCLSNVQLRNHPYFGKKY